MNDLIALLSKLNIKFSIRNKTLSLITMIFIYIPIVIFLFGWCNLIWAILGTLVSAYGIKRLYQSQDDEKTEYSVIALILMIAITIPIMVICGWGGIYPQHYDWFKANAILSDMVKYPWPVTYVNGTETSMLTYYIGMYMTPALIGKIFGEMSAFVFLSIQQLMIIGLIWFNVIRILKIKNFIPTLITNFNVLLFGFPVAISWIFHSILMHLNIEKARDIFVGAICISECKAPVYDTEFQLMENYSMTTNYLSENIFEFRGNLFGLNSFFPFFMILLISIIWWENKQKLENYMVICLPLLLYCTISLPYMFILAVILFIKEFIRSEHKWKDIRTNLIVFITALPMLAYLLGSVAKGNDSIYYDLRLNVSLGSLIFVVQLLPYYLFGLKRHKKDIYYHLIYLFAFISSVLLFGRYNDLMLDGSIPITSIIMLYVIDEIKERIENKEYKKTKNIMALSIIGIMLILSFCVPFAGLYDQELTPLFERGTAFTYADTLTEEKLALATDEEKEIIMNDKTQYMFIDNFTNMGCGYVIYPNGMVTFANRQLKGYEEDLLYNYFTYDYKDKIFYKYFSRR